MNLAELLAQAADLAALSDEELAQLDADLVAAAEELAAADLTPEALASLAEIQTATTAIREEGATREAAAAELADQARAALDAIRGPGDEPDPEPAADDDATPEPEPTPDAEPEPAADPEPVPVAASVPAVPARPRLGRVAAPRPGANRPARTSHAPSQGIARFNLVAAASLGNIVAGEPVQDEEKLADLMGEAVRTTMGYTGGARVKVPVARIGGDGFARRVYGDQRYLGRDAVLNARVLERALTPESLQAAGGICAPPEPIYTQPTLGVTTRPVWDGGMLARFGADRGAVTTLAPPVLADVEDAVDVWTMDTDENPNGATKPCLTLTCPDEDTTEVYAVTECLRYGNFRARFFAEQLEAWLRLTGVQHARFAERRLLTTIGAGSTQVTTGQLLGTTRDVLAALDRATAAIESYFRDEGITFTWGCPVWLYDMMRTDLARQLPGDSGGQIERLAMTDAQLSALFTARGITPHLLLDGETGQEFGPQGDGPLQGWPSTVVTYLYPQGSWLGLDGGMFQFGIIRDSSLVSTNEAIQFSETVEAAHFHGHVSYRLAMDVCPDGTVSGTSDIDPCSTGS